MKKVFNKFNYFDFHTIETHFRKCYLTILEKRYKKYQLPNPSDNKSIYQIKIEKKNTLHTIHT